MRKVKAMWMHQAGVGLVQGKGLTPAEARLLQVGESVPTTGGDA